MRLDGVARITPVFRSATFSVIAGRDVWLKAENLQRTGSFKVRGAVTRISSLESSDRAAGVVAASAGNHGQAVAWAAREFSVPATIFVPQYAPMAKVEATRSYGARVEMAGERFEDAVEAGLSHAESNGAPRTSMLSRTAACVAGRGRSASSWPSSWRRWRRSSCPLGAGACSRYRSRCAVQTFGCSRDRRPQTPRRPLLSRTGLPSSEPWCAGQADSRRTARSHGGSRERRHREGDRARASSGRSSSSKARAPPVLPPCSRARSRGRGRSR